MLQGDSMEGVMVMYRSQAVITGQRARYGGIGNVPPQTQTEFQKQVEKRALEDHEARVSVLIADLILDEADAIRKYDYLLALIDKSPRGYMQGRELIAHIREQEISHAALLKRLR